MEVQGRIKMVGETQSFGSNGFRKREIVVTTEEQYPQHIMVEFVQDKCDLLNSYKEGQQVKINIKHLIKKVYLLSDEKYINKPSK